MDKYRLMELLKKAVEHIEAFEEDYSEEVFSALGFTKDEMAQIKEEDVRDEPNFTHVSGKGENIMKAVDIEWDVDFPEDIEFLPTEIEIPKGMVDEEEISDYISDVTGFCHKGYYLIESEADIKTASDNLIKAMVAYGLEYSWSDSEIIHSLTELGITYDDFCHAGAQDFVKDYLEPSSSPKPTLSEQIRSASNRTVETDSVELQPDKASSFVR